MFKTSFIILSIALACCASDILAQPIQNERPDQTPQELVQSLGSPDDTVRIGSEQELLSLGKAAVDELQKGSHSVDIEISSRCQLILERIEKSLKEKNEKAFLESDENSAGSVTWLKFESLLEDNSRDARNLFLSICKQHTKTFKDLELVGIDDDSASGAIDLARSAASLLESGQYRSVDVVFGYMFVDHIARERLDKFAETPEVKAYRKQQHLATLKSLNYLSSNSRLGIGWHHACREPLEKLLAKWFRLVEFDETTAASFTKNRIVYSSLNEFLIEELVSRYDAMDEKTRFELIDIIDHYSSSEQSRRRKIDKAKVASWLGPAIKDETVLATTRLRKKPGSEIEVTARQCALAVASRIVSDPAIRKKLILSSFGKLPLSSKSLQILKDKDTEREILEKLSKIEPENKEDSKDSS